MTMTRAKPVTIRSSQARITQLTESLGDAERLMKRAMKEAERAFEQGAAKDGHQWMQAYARGVDAYARLDRQLSFAGNDAVSSEAGEDFDVPAMVKRLEKMGVLKPNSLNPGLVPSNGSGSATPGK